MEMETTKKQTDWLSLTQVTKNNNRHLNSACLYYLKAEITQNKDNTKQLYNLTAKLTSIHKDNHMPNEHLDQDLANILLTSF